MASTFIDDVWECDPYKAHPWLVPVIVSAVRTIGVLEKPLGSNRGPEIDQWLRAAGVEPGNPWCASVLTAEWYAKTPKPVIRRMASAYKIHAWAKEAGCLVPDGEPLLPGDICGVFKKDDPRTPKREDFQGHVGLLCSVLADGRLATIEGNVRSACRALVRTRVDWAWFARPLMICE